MKVKRKQYSSKILNTNVESLGFTRGRKYDTDFDRLGRMETSQRELIKGSNLNFNKELKSLNNELNVDKDDDI